MIQIGSFEAKTHFSQIIQKVGQGEEFLVTKNGKPVARIVAVDPENNTTTEAIDAILAIGKKNKASQKEIREWLNEGRKY